METSIPIYNLILLPQAEMKVSIILMLQMWELRHSKAKKLAQIQHQTEAEEGEPVCWHSSRDTCGLFKLCALQVWFGTDSSVLGAAGTAYYKLKVGKDSVTN